METPFDATMKELLDRYPADWAEFVRRTLDLPGTVWMYPLDADLSTVSPSADKLYRIRGTTDAVIHLEFQSSRDDDLPERSLTYSVLARRRHKLPVHTLLILLRPEADSPKYDGRFSLTWPTGEEYLSFRYSLVRVWQLPLQPLLEGGLGTLPLTMLTEEASQDLDGARRGFFSRLDSLQPVVSKREEVSRATSVLMGLRYRKDIVRSLMQRFLDQVKRDSSVYQGWLEDSREEGRSEVRTEMHNNLCSLVLGMAANRFGDAPEGVRDRVFAIPEIDRLNRVALRVLTAADWEDLVSTP